MANVYPNILSVKKMVGVLEGKTVVCPHVRLDTTFDPTASNVYYPQFNGRAFKFEGTALATGRANQNFITPLQRLARHYFDGSYGSRSLGVDVTDYPGEKGCRISWFVGDSGYIDTAEKYTTSGPGATLAATLLIYEDNAGNYTVVPSFVDSNLVNSQGAGLSLTDATSSAFGFYSVPAQTYAPFPSQYFYAVYAGKSSYSPFIPAALTPAEDLAFSRVTLDPWAYIYDGTAKTPAVTVTLFGMTLTQGTDYTVAYSDNVELGTATVTVTGTGDYYGTKTAHFYIHLHHDDAETFLQGVAVGRQLKGWGVVGSGGISRDRTNILSNPYFWLGGTVDATYTNTVNADPKAKETVSEWYINNGSVTLNADRSVTVSRYSTAVAPAGYFMQHFPKTILSHIYGKRCTFVAVVNGVRYQAYATAVQGPLSDNAVIATANFGWFRIRVYYYRDVDYFAFTVDVFTPMTITELSFLVPNES